jgi:hypothetical protein
MLNLRFPRWSRPFSLLFTIVLVLVAMAAAQTSVSTGAIVGTVTDPSGAVVSSARVTITNLGTNQSANATTTSTGLYNSGSLVPGSYRVRVEAKGFRTSEMTVQVEVGAIASGSLKMQLGQENQIVEVQASSVQVNTEQATVQGVVTPDQIENLPVNGRNFLDLAQLEPGVQIQDGQGFDPTKNGFMSISIGGRAGRTARIEVDGVDISDENVGTTTQDIAASAIQEFQIAQSSLDLSSSLTSSGTVNVTTKSGTNTLHGEGFYGFRDNRAGFAAFPGGATPGYQRNQMGGSLGGAIIKDKLFFFGDAERTKQDFGNAVSFAAPFSDLSGSYSAPFRDNEELAKLDWVVRPNMRMFYRFTYNNNSDLKPGNNYSPFLNRDNTPAHAIGLDFTTGSFTHSIRAGYSKFVNSVSPATGGGLIDPDPNLFIINTGLQTGPNVNAPQKTIQSNRQIKYDGSVPWRNHIFRYGGAVNRISVFAFAAFGAFGTQVQGQATPANQQAILDNPGAFAPALIAGGSPTDNPLNYPVTNFTIFNGAGAFSEKSAFGSPVGGFADTRFEFYLGDAWKLRPNLTVNYGVHYVRDTNRNNNDLPDDPTLQASLNQFGPRFGNKANSPNLNFSPEVGIAWDPFKNGKTVLRAGAGLYYENTIINDLLFDRVLRLPTGLFFGSQPICGNGTTSAAFPDGSNVTSSDGLDIETQICGQPLSASFGGTTVATALADLQRAYQASTAAVGPAQNGLYEPGLGTTFALMLAPNYVSPRSFQLNLGFQQQITRGTVLSVDYVHNNATHFLLGVDVNHVGAARNLNVGNAQTAIANTLATCGVSSINDAISAGVCPNASGVGTHTATIVDFAQNGLDGSGAFANPAAAFPGNNPAVGLGEFFSPIGDSRYEALQMSLRSNMDHPFRGVKRMNMVVSYALSRLDSNYPYTANPGQQVLGDQDFLNNAVDWDHPNKYFGPSAQDRTHQLSFGPMFEIAHGPRLGVIGHVDSPLPVTMFLPQLGGGGQPGEIFRTDVTGDGTFGAAGQGGDIVPGSNVGSFGRSVSPSGLNGFINSYNQASAGQLTPAGQALVTANLFTQDQLVSLGAVTPTIQPAPVGNVGMGWLKSVDLRFSWPITVKERLVIEPSFTAFNLFNFANFDNSVNQLSGILQANPGTSINAVTGFTSNCGSVATCRAGDRIGPGSGVFSLGSPRELEFGLKLRF